jgi:hypothetical protein
MYLKNIWFRNNPGNADKAAEEFLETTQIIQVGQYTRGGQAQLIFESAIAIPQLEGSTSATFKEMLLRNRNSAIPQSQFFLESATSSPQLESFTSTIFGTFFALKYSVDS